jgi:UDP-N-acetylmuramoyl-tripeptide--D-alanyl-D-alanine ligase
MVAPGIKGRTGRLGSLFTVSEILEATGGRLIQGDPAEIAFAGVSTDSRTVKAGDLFIALRGERFDGFQFLNEALRRGAAGAVISVMTHRIPETREEEELRRGRVIIGVNDTLLALQDVSAFHRARFRLPVLAVTGSNGKTTTKEMAARILATEMDVLKNEGNINNQIGVPLTLLRLSAHHQAAVIEMGISREGEMRRLCRIAKPGLGLITNIGPTHLETLGTLEGVAAAKGELLESLSPESGISVLNKDDPFFGFLKQRAPGPVVTFGTRGDAQVCGVDVTETGPFSVSFRLVVDPSVRGLLGMAADGADEGSETVIRLPIPGVHNVANAVAAAAVAAIAGRSLETVRNALESFEPIRMRTQLIRWRGVEILNDAYNANPASMLAALEMLAAVPASGRRIGVLGDMLELGDAAEVSHRRVGERMARIERGWLIAVGSLSGAVAEAARAAGMAEDRIRSCGDAAEAAEIVRNIAREGDVMLVKGSRGVHLERIIEGLVGR